MSWEPTQARQGRTAVFVLVAAIFVATALAIALVVGAASRASDSSHDGLEVVRNNSNNRNTPEVAISVPAAPAG